MGDDACASLCPALAWGTLQSSPVQHRAPGTRVHLWGGVREAQRPNPKGQLTTLNSEPGVHCSV